MFRVFTIVSFLTFFPFLQSCKEKVLRSPSAVDSEYNSETELREMLTDEKLSLTDGIASSDSSMLISDNMAHFDELLERKYPRLIAMPVEQQLASGQRLSESDFNNLKRNIADRLSLYYHKDTPKTLKTTYPILSFQVNTSGIHWETVIVDLNDLAKSPPSLKFEQWNFLGGEASLASEKINQVKAAVVDVLTGLRSGRHFESRNNVELKRQIPSAEELHRYLERYYARHSNVAVVREGDKFFVEFGGQKFPVLLEEVEHEYLGKAWEVQHTTFQEINRPKKLLELLDQFNNSRVKRPAIDGAVDKHYLNVPNLIQGPNNCGVASAWITEQRAKGVGESDIRTANPGGYHEYRRTMLANLHEEFKGVKLPQSGVFAYPRASYTNDLPKYVPSVKPQASNPKPPSFSKLPNTLENDFDIMAKPISYKKWWLGRIAVTSIAAGFILYIDQQEQQAKKKKAGPNE